MRAVVLRSFGPPEVLVAEEVQDPVVGPGQVLVNVEAVSVVFVETQIRAGGGPGSPELPMVPGNGVGGVITDVGADVDRTLVGTRVISTTGGRGGYAEQVTVDAAEPIPIPDALDTPTATALLADGRTAVKLSRAVAPAAGEWVLVEAAGGGVGSLLVQLARDAGARVIGAASGPAKLRLAAELGARATVDYTDGDWTRRVREITGGTGVDLVFDGVGGDIGGAALGLLRDGGRFMVHGMASGTVTDPPADEVARRELRTLDLGSGPEVPLRELSGIALEQAAAGRLRPTIGRTLSLEHAPDAHAAIEARAVVGKTLLIP